MIDATDLANMRAGVESVMLTSCTVRTPGAATSDGAGGQTAGTPTDVVTTCTVYPTSGEELEIVARLTTETTYTVKLPQATTIDTDCEILIDSEAYQVIAVLSPGSLATCKRVIAVKRG